MTLTNRKQTVLVADDNPDHQVLPGYVIQRSLTDTVAVFTAASEQALAYFDTIRRYWGKTVGLPHQ